VFDDIQEWAHKVRYLSRKEVGRSRCLSGLPNPNLLEITGLLVIHNENSFIIWMWLESQQRKLAQIVAIPFAS